MALDAQDRARRAKLPPMPAPLDVRRRLIERFRLTIPLRRPLIVSYLNAMNTELRTATGLPVAVLDDVIHIRTDPRSIVIVPHASLVSMKRLYPQELP